MTTVKNFIHIIWKTILFLLGLALCGYIFYIRLIVVRVPHEIIFAWNKYLCIGYFLLVLLYGFLLIRILIPFIYTPKESEMAKDPTKLTWLQKGIKWVREAYEEALFLVYFWCIDKPTIIRIPVIKIFHFCMKKIYNFLLTPHNFEKRNSFLIALYTGLRLIPRLIVLIAFFIDVVIFQYFYYLYMCIILLIIPLAWRIIFYILKHRLEIYQKYISIFVYEVTDLNTVTIPDILQKIQEATEPFSIYMRREISEKTCEDLNFIPSNEAYKNLIEDAQMLNAIQEHVVDILNDASYSFWYIRLQITVYLLSLNIWLYMLNKQIMAYIIIV